MNEWPEKPVYLNHLEAMGICMALMGEEEDDGLSEPQRDAYEKVQALVGELLADLRLKS